MLFININYATEADVVEAVRKAFVKQGLIYQYSMEEVVQIAPDICRAKIRFTIIDSDSGEKLDSVVFGDGQDKGDKAVYKSITGCQKYFLMKTLLIATDDDPEKDTEATFPKLAKVMTKENVAAITSDPRATGEDMKSLSQDPVVPVTIGNKSRFSTKTFTTTTKPTENSSSQVTAEVTSNNATGSADASKPAAIKRTFGKRPATVATEEDVEFNE